MVPSLPVTRFSAKRAPLQRNENPATRRVFRTSVVLHCVSGILSKAAVKLVVFWLGKESYMAPLVRIRILLIGLLVFLVTGCSDHDGVGFPGLRSLAVAGASGSMFPTFDTKIRHYGIRCESSDVLQIRAAAVGSGQEISVAGGIRGRGELNFEIANPEVGQDVVLEVFEGNRTANYTLHCIPGDVPNIEISVSTPDASAGLLFVTPQYTESGARKTYLMIMDNNGVPRFQRMVDGRAVDFKRHPNGFYTYAMGIGRNQFGLPDAVIVVLDSELNEVETLSTVGLTHTDNHDFLFTDEGNKIFISYHSSVRDMTAFGLSPDEIVGDSVIQEVDPNGNVVFEWNSWDHMDISDCAGYPRFPDDYAHLNAISFAPDGDLIGSFRGCAQVLKIDRHTGNVEWFLGGSKSDFLIVGDSFQEFCGQHTAWQLRNGNVLLFDNGNVCLGDREALFGEFSRVVEYSLDFATGQANFVRDYSLNGSYQEFTRSQGSVQPLPNGNWIISWGNGPDTSVTEVNRSGEKVFEMRLSADDNVAVSYRAFRIEESELQ